MNKKTFIGIMVGTVGGIIFAIGLCMCIVSAWNLFKLGIALAIIGFFIQLFTIPLYGKINPKKEDGTINWGLIATWVAGILGAVIMGYGKSRVLVHSSNTSDIIIGLIATVVGLLICVLNHPIYAYTKTNKIITNKVMNNDEENEE